VSREENFFSWGPEVTNQQLMRGGHMLVEMLLDFAMPFTSLSKLYKNKAKTIFFPPNVTDDNEPPWFVIIFFFSHV
jgi:hypothetical protein